MMSSFVSTQSRDTGMSNNNSNLRQVCHRGGTLIRQLGETVHVILFGRGQRANANLTLLPSTVRRAPPPPNVLVPVDDDDDNNDDNDDSKEQEEKKEIIKTTSNVASVSRLVRGTESDMV